MTTINQPGPNDILRLGLQEFKIVQEGGKMFIIVQNNKQNVTVPTSSQHGGKRQLSSLSDGKSTQSVQSCYSGTASPMPRLGLSPDLHAIQASVSQPLFKQLADTSLTRDNVRRNLANIGDESDDDNFNAHPSEMASVFGLHDEGDSQVQTVTLSNSKQLQRLTERRSKDVPSPDLNNSNTCPSRKLFSSPLASSQSPVATLYPMPLDKTPNGGSQTSKEMPATPTILRYAYKTPTPELPNSKNGAVRKIFIIQESPVYNKTDDKKVCQTLSEKTIKKLTWHKPCTPAFSSKQNGTLRVPGKRSQLTETAASSNRKQAPQVVIVSRHGVQPCDNFNYQTSCASTSPSTPKTVHIHIAQIPETCGSATKTGLMQPDQVRSIEEGDESLDDSLTNIQWLRGLASDGLVSKNNKKYQPTPKVCSLSQRPSYSYMRLIEMALRSRDDKMMTLREICKWIEDTFPFYKHTAKPGWKNSIRHNLSVYEMFVRVQSKPKKHGSHWTVKENCSKKPKPYKTSAQNKAIKSDVPVNDLHPQLTGALGSNLLSFLPMLSSSTPMVVPVSMPGNNMPMQIPLINSQYANTQPKKKKGPTPILPRPPPLPSRPGPPDSGPVQAYALVPLQSLQGSIQQSVQSNMAQSQDQPMLLAAPARPNTVASTNSLQSGPMSTVANPQKVTVKETEHTMSYEPEEPVNKTAVYTTNMIKEAWQKASCMEEPDTHSNLIHAGRNTAAVEQPQKRVKIKPGLPKPKMYHKPRSRSKARIHNQKSSGTASKFMSTSSTPLQHSDNLVYEDFFFDDIENGLPTPLRNLLDTPSNGSISTSTPFKSMGESPRWLSPIRGFTPFRNGSLPDGSFLDFLPNTMDPTSPALVTPIKSLEAWMKIANGLMDTPNASLISPSRSPGRPLDCSKNNTKDLYPVQSISRLLAEIDPCLVDDLDHVQFNLSVTNYHPMDGDLNH